MTVRLTVRTAIWRAHVARVVESVDGLVPVVKGNGYGFGRAALAELAAQFSDTLAVGTVHELDVVPADVHAVVLTPVLAASLERDDVRALIEHHDPILTVGSDAHVAALRDAGLGIRTVVKAASPMQRYGIDPAECGRLVSELRSAQCEVVGVAMHPPLVGTPDERMAPIIAALDHIDPDLPVWLSHRDPDDLAALPDSHTYRLRLGTSLWHGDKAALQLSADVIDTRTVAADDVAGYRLTSVPTSGTLVMIGAGTAHGVAPLADGRSPFHFDRTRLALLEAPHMHTSMAFVPTGDPTPEVGDRVDVQRPMHMTSVDEYEWI